MTHGVLSGGAVARIASSPIETMVITDLILATEAVRLAPNIRQITIAPLMAEAMRRISDESSVSSLFDSEARSTTKQHEDDREGFAAFVLLL